MLLSIPTQSTKMINLMTDEQKTLFNNANLWIVYPNSGNVYLENGLQASTTDSIQIPSSGLILSTDGNWNVIGSGTNPSIRILVV